MAKVYNTTDLRPDQAFECHVFHRDQFAHYLRWTHVLKEAKIDFRLLVTPDHPTPIAIKTHARDPIPFFIYDSTNETDSHISCYCEKEANQTGVMIEKGYTLMNKLLNR